MSDEKESPHSSDGSILPADEEEALRKQVRNRLAAEYEREHARQSRHLGDPSAAELLRAERLRIVRAEEDAFYAKRGLYRYKNYRGEYEWLTKEEGERRLASRQRKSRRSSRSFLDRLMSDRLIGDVINGLIVLGVLVIAVLVFRRENRPYATYVISVRSEPAGAAIFVDGEPANATTNAGVSVAGPGLYTIHILKPGYRAMPPEAEIHVTDDNKAPVVSFSLYPEAPNSSPPQARSK